jgi:hypothetical protein
MKYDIYFHNDFDGRASAAVMLAFLRSRGDDIGKYVAMTYGKTDGWFSDDFFKKGNPAIVVDFMYHPGAAWWFDHHASTFKKTEWQKGFKSDKQHRLKPEYASCCGLVYASLKRDFGWKPPKHFVSFIKTADLIDGAGYRSARQTIEMKEIGLQMNAFVEALSHTAAEDKLVIGLMSQLTLEEVVKHPTIAKKIAQLKKKVKKSLAFQKKNMQVFKRSTFVDLAGDPLNGLLRFAPYSFYPKTNFSIRMRPKGKLWYLGVAANPWNRAKGKLDIDLGALMRAYRGGGHKGIGATEFPTRAKALEAAKEINALLNT